MKLEKLMERRAQNQAQAEAQDQVQAQTSQQNPYYDFSVGPPMPASYAQAAQQDLSNKERPLYSPPWLPTRNTSSHSPATDEGLPLPPYDINLPPFPTTDQGLPLPPYDISLPPFPTTMSGGSGGAQENAPRIPMSSLPQLRLREREDSFNQSGYIYGIPGNPIHTSAPSQPHLKESSYSIIPHPLHLKDIHRLPEESSYLAPSEQEYYQRSQQQKLIQQQQQSSTGSPQVSSTYQSQQQTRIQDEVYYQQQENQWDEAFGERRLEQRG